jgi:hypothetical protein
MIHVSHRVAVARINVNLEFFRHLFEERVELRSES